MEDQAKQSQTWWQKNKRLLIIIAVIILALLLVFTLAVSWFGWDWTGFTGGESKVTKTPQGTNTEYSSGKTLWDWMQLLLVPIILAIGGYWLTQIQKNREERAAAQRAETDRNIAFDNQHAAALQAYINNMSELLLEKGLRQSKPEDDIRKIARAQTLTALSFLGIRRKRSVLQFLNESGLISKVNPIINLDEADIRDARLRDIILKRVNLKGVYLYGADLRDADLRESDLQSARLDGVDLSGADLTRVNLQNAKVTKEQLSKAISLHNATMPNGSIHP